jgi:hypothetical protein
MLTGAYSRPKVLPLYKVPLANSSSTSTQDSDSDDGSNNTIICLNLHWQTICLAIPMLLICTALVLRVSPLLLDKLDLREFPKLGGVLLLAVTRMHVRPLKMLIVVYRFQDGACSYLYEQRKHE